MWYTSYTLDTFLSGYYQRVVKKRRGIENVSKVYEVYHSLKSPNPLVFRWFWPHASDAPGGINSAFHTVLTSVQQTAAKAVSDPRKKDRPFVL
jgi:hypothetical protein